MNQTANNLVSVDLKTLVNLAVPATLLTMHSSRISSKQSGNYISSFKGRGIEFDEARLYQPGDDIRSIDWRVTARAGKTYTKVFREDREKPIFISVDSRSAMHFATRGVFKFVQATKIAALLAWIAQKQGDRIGGQIYTDSVCQELKPQNGKHATLRFFNVLLKTVKSTTQNMSLQQALIRLVKHAKPGNLIYIISDFRGLNQKAEKHIAKLSYHCEVVLIQIYDPLESHLPDKGRYRFSNEKHELTIDTTDKNMVFKYQERYKNRLTCLYELKRKLNIRFFQCSTENNPIEILRQCLILR